MAKWLLKTCGADAETGNNDGDTPLHLACRGGHIAIASWLVNDVGVSPVCTANDGNTALHFAALDGKLDAAKWLVIECKVNPRLTNDGGYYPFQFACQGGYVFSLVMGLLSSHLLYVGFTPPRHAHAGCWMLILCSYVYVR